MDECSMNTAKIVTLSRCSLAAKGLPGLNLRDSSAPEDHRGFRMTIFGWFFLDLNLDVIAL